MDILDMSINQMAGLDFDCKCGRHHSLSSLKSITVGKGVLPELTKLAAPFRDKTVLVYGDDHTRAAAGDRAAKLLEDAGFKVKTLFLPSNESGILIPDEHALGRLLMAVEPSVGLLVGIGSGTLNDMGKYISAKTGIPFIIVCAAPSMDGYASDTSPLICEGFKVSFPSVLPYAILGDTDVLSAAPDRLLQAGFGDVIGKRTALADWLLAKDMVGEYYCETCVELVDKALDKVEKNAAGIAARESSGISYLTEALILTGVAMGLIGVSRPASGAEHQMSHYWEMNFISRGLYPELHGIKVGLSTPIVAEIFEYMSDCLPDDVKAIAPKREYIEGLLHTVGAPVSPKEIGIDRQLFHDCLMNANKTRKRYSILELAIAKGRLGEIADKITERIYG